MTAIGILNIVFGALGAVAGALMVLGAGVLTATGASSVSEEGNMLALGGGILMIIAVVALGVSVMLLASGIGILKVAPWGRTLSIICGVLGMLVHGASLATSSFSITSAAALGYSVLLAVMCFTPAWRAAFSGSAGDEAGDYEDHQSQTRRAA
jgi:hypothetical protein